MIKLSVIIPTRNRAALLQMALQTLQSQTLSSNSFEVLVIDNGSTDNTKQVVESAQKRLGNVRYFYDPTPGLHVGRHLGLKMARSDILVYADDDIEAFPTWLEAIAESFQDPEVVLVGGKNLPKWESDPPDWILKMWEPDKNGNRILGYLSILDLGDQEKEISPFYVFGCNFSIRKRVLLEASGFHPDGMPEDMIVFRGDGESHVANYILLKKYKAFYNPKASIYHKVPKTRLLIEYYQKRYFLEGISYSYKMTRNRPSINCKNLINNLINTILSFLSIKQMPQFIKLSKRSFKDGYQFHQKAVRNNRELYRWITKPNYLDE